MYNSNCNISKVYRYTLQEQETIEAKLREYEHALDNAATLYHQIGQLITTQSNDYTRDVMTRFTTATIIIQYLEPYSAEMRLLISL